MSVTWNHPRTSVLHSFGRSFLFGACAWLALGLVSARPLRAQTPNTVTGTAGFETGLQLLTSGIRTPYYASSTDSSVTVDWGDGLSTAGLVQQSGAVVGVGGTYSVYGTHLYAQPGAYTITMTFQYCAYPVVTVDCTVPDPIVGSGFATALDYTSATISPPGKFVILSIGDSVASGEGNPVIASGHNDVLGGRPS